MLPVDSKGNIKENDKIIGKCKSFKDVNLEKNHCPQGDFIQLYICKRCRHFKSID